MTSCALLIEVACELLYDIFVLITSGCKGRLWWFRWWVDGRKWTRHDWQYLYTNAAPKQSFNAFKHNLTHAPILVFPDKLSFTMCMDLSSLFIDGIFMQTVYGECWQVIAYNSCILNAAKSKYFMTYLESVAIVRALQHFWDIIFGYPITIYTDHTAGMQLFGGKTSWDA